MNLRKDAQIIINNSLEKALPNAKVKEMLKDFNNKAYYISIGKAAWEMGKACEEALGDNLIKGIVITKYDHSQGDIRNTDIYEAGHPLLDENGINASKKVTQLAESLSEDDYLIFLISGGGSALFEIPEDNISLEDLILVNDKLIKSGANIKEINIIRKRLSKVKGGKFLNYCKANIKGILLSDVIGDAPEDIASGPITKDKSMYEDVVEIINKYNLKFSDNIMEQLKTDTPKDIKIVETQIIGSNQLLTKYVEEEGKKLNYNTEILTDKMEGEAKEIGVFLACLADHLIRVKKRIGRYCIIMGGESTVTVTGGGKGGRNQEIALAGAEGISGLENTVLFSFGSDGTDGPTDAAGGIVDNNSFNKLSEKGIVVKEILENNDSYNGLKEIDGLIFTGPTGTNINDVSVILIDTQD